MHVNLLVARLPRLVLTVLLGVLPASAATTADNSLFARSNLVAWCIVPFDAKQRSPEARAAMLERLGITQLAYDYRAEHIPTFDAEIEALKRHHLRLLAWWFPGVLNDEARLILGVIERHQLRGVQLWVSGGGEPATSAGEQAARVAAEALRIQPIAAAAGRLGCSVALYNHGGWFGEPENQIAIIERLRTAGATNLGIVYNQHHGHDHLGRFASLLALMKPYLVALNLNGMARDGDQLGRKILPLGQGELDLQLLTIIRESGWRGPIGILNHTDEDAEARLLDNLDGLDWLLKQTPDHPVGPKPQPRTWRAPPAQPSAGGARLLPSQDRISGVVARQEPRPTGFTATEQGRNEPGALAEPAPGRAGGPREAAALRNRYRGDRWLVHEPQPRIRPHRRPGRSSAARASG